MRYVVVWKNEGGVNDAAVAVATSDDDDDDDDGGDYVEWLALKCFAKRR